MNPETYPTMESAAVASQMGDSRITKRIDVVITGDEELDFLVGIMGLYRGMQVNSYQASRCLTYLLGRLKDETPTKDNTLAAIQRKLAIEERRDKAAMISGTLSNPVPDVPPPWYAGMLGSLGSTSAGKNSEQF